MCLMPEVRTFFLCRSCCLTLPGFCFKLSACHVAECCTRTRGTRRFSRVYICYGFLFLEERADIGAQPQTEAKNLKKELALRRGEEWEGPSLWPKILPDPKLALKDSYGKVCFCLLLCRIFKWTCVDESSRLLVYGGCSFWGTGSEDTKFYPRPICVVLGKLLLQFLLVPNCLLLPFPHSCKLPLAGLFSSGWTVWSLGTLFS